jgi:CheY-like chemotaxis protein
MPAVEMDGVNGKLSLPLDDQDIKNILESSSEPKKHGRTDNKTTLLLIDDNKIHNEALSEFAEEIVDQCLVAPTAQDAFSILNSASVNCIVLDLTLPDATGDEVLAKLSSDSALSHIPVIIYSGRSLTSHQKNQLLEHASDVIQKNVGSHSKLMSRISDLIKPIKQTSEEASGSINTESSPQSVLVVDDDNQSYFSMSSLLESEGRVVHRAVNGSDALQLLEARKDDIGLVLLDLMMPEMDGFETIKRIREDLKMTTLPVFIVTAKAMKGDREECLKHGATDYISKPVSPEKLEQLMSIWLP